MNTPETKPAIPRRLSQFWRSSIRNRLAAIVVGSSIIPVLLISIFLGWITFVQVREALIRDTFDRLSAIEAIKLSQLQGYFDERQSDMEALRETVEALRDNAFDRITAVNTLKRANIARLFEDWSADVRDVASDPGVVAGMADLASGFQSLGVSQARSLYLGKGELESAGDGSEYSTAHFEQHGFFAGYTAIHGYEDAFLIDPAGNIVYNVQKGESFGTNLVTGPYKESNLAVLYKNLVSAKAGDTYVADAASFEDGTHLFMGTPIYNGDTFTGILAYQLPVSQINEVMAEQAGLGETSETFLVAREPDGRITLRNDRLSVGDEFVIGFDITERVPQFVQKAADGKTGKILSAGGQGESVVAVYEPIQIEGLNWGLVGKVGAEEALVPKHADAEKDYLALYAENFGYYDIFLMGADGYAFYTIAREPDYHTNLVTGPYKDSNLGALVQEILEEPATLFTDVAFYAPSGNAPAAFFGVPVFENPDNTGNLQMIVAAQISIDDINQIMNEASGLGETGESYIIGQDFLGRMDSRFIEQFGVETTVLNPDFAVDTRAVRSAIAGESGQDTIIDYRGLPVMSVWAPFVIYPPNEEHPEGQVWAVMTEIDESEALQPINLLARSLGIAIGLTALVVGAMGVVVGTRFALGFVKPILNLTETATQVAAGNLDLRLATDSVDEIGTLTATFNNMTEQLQDTLEGLEQRVSDRTKDLATVARISTATASIRDPFEMLANMVHLTQRGFDLYHAHVFTYYKDTEVLQIVACGYKEGDEHEGTHGAASIPIRQEQSLVARAARTRRPVIVNDVRSDPGWLPNPLLPDTHAELAVPMIVGDELLGVLDVQADHVDAFSEESANIQMTLASQVATALQNAQSYDRAKKQADLESLVNMIGQRIQRTVSIEDTLQTAIRELGTAIGASRVKISIGGPQEGNGAEEGEVK
jgi:methyl-accepting chemotaxis protein